jgi:hypothetical protein
LFAGSLLVAKVFAVPQASVAYRPQAQDTRACTHTTLFFIAPVPSSNLRENSSFDWQRFPGAGQECFGKDLARLFVIINYQRPDARQIRNEAFCLSSDPISNQDVKVKVLPRPGLALGPDKCPPSSQRGVWRSRVQARCRILSCRRSVGLCERLKQLGALLRRHADPSIAN